MVARAGIIGFARVHHADNAPTVAGAMPHRIDALVQVSAHTIRTKRATIIRDVCDRVPAGAQRRAKRQAGLNVARVSCKQWPDGCAVRIPDKFASVRREKGFHAASSTTMTK